MDSDYDKKTRESRQKSRKVGDTMEQALEVSIDMNDMDVIWWVEVSACERND